MPVHFVTTEYRLSHGREPRGRGSWAFRFRRGAAAVENPEAPAHADALVFWAPGSQTYGEAKRWARAKARELRADAVEVCS